MKKNIITLALTIIFGASATATTPIEGTKKEVNTTESTITWKGYKVTGSHHGNIAITSGHLEFEDGTLSGGEFVVDMTSITCTDLDGGMKGKLEGHLKSKDFFGVEQHPTSKLVFTDVKANGKNSYAVTANLTIKDITKQVSFDISIYGSKASASLKVDRAEYDVRYGSGSFFDNLGDKTIYDEFDLVIDLVF